eukprot:UN05321
MVAMKNETHGKREIKHDHPPTLHQMEKLRLMQEVQENSDCHVSGEDDDHTEQHLTILSMELIPFCRGALKPDPQYDSILVLAFVMQVSSVPKLQKILVNGERVKLKPSCFPPNIEVQYFDTETEMLDHFVDVILEFDPDMVLGYEIQKQSWGYLVERSLYLEGRAMPINLELGRIILQIRQPLPQRSTAKPTWKT